MNVGPIIASSGERGEMVFTESVSPMLKLITSGSAAVSVTLVSWIAARNVHWMPRVLEVSHLPLPGFVSGASPALLTVASAKAGPGERARSNPQSATSATSASSVLHSGVRSLVVARQLNY